VKRLVPLVAVVLAALGAPAGAEDPAGFPSVGSAAPAPAPTLDDVAKQRMAALRKFVRDKQTDPKFAEHEHVGGGCRIDHGRKVVELTFNANGVLHCRLAEVAEGYQIDVFVLTVKSLYATGDHYFVTAKPGEPLKVAPIHGSSDVVKATISMLSGLHAEAVEADWWHAPRLLGPFHTDSVTLTVSLDEAGVEAETKLSIAPLYVFNLGAVALVGPGYSSYSVVDGKIAESTNRADISYYLGVHVYPLSWNRNGNKKLRPGRYYNDHYSDGVDRISLVLGVNLAHPTEGGYAGISLELYNGIAITGGWQPRKVHRLHDGSSVGDPIMGDAAPTDSKWDLTGWGVGLSINATLLKPLVSMAK
jgi:hypothetical protein